MGTSAGARFRSLLKEEQPLQIVGTVNAFSALLAQRAGHQAIYLSGAGVANASFGLPDLGLTTLADVLEDARRISSSSDLPLMVDIDTGFGDSAAISKCIKAMNRAGVAAVHLEDQIPQKRCGHRPNKRIVSCEQMVDRIKAAVDGKDDPDFFILARTDAHANEGLNGAIDRAMAYLEAGADGIFPEALKSIEDFRAFNEATGAVTLANMTEFGKTPLFDLGQLAEVKCAMVLYPLSAFRSMAAAALETYRTIAVDGHQRNRLESMQTRADLYDILDYYKDEQKLDDIDHPQT